MLRFCLTFGAVVAVVLSLGETASARRAGDTADQFQKAFAVAQDAVPGGQLIRARVEMNGKVGGFYFWLDGKMYEIEVSLSTLRVIKQAVSPSAVNTPQVSADVLKLIGQQKAAKTKLPEGRLLEIAGEALKDTGISEVKYTVVDGKLLFQVGDLVLDAATGKPVQK